MPKYKVKESENILFHGQHVTGGSIITATVDEIEALRKKGIDSFIEVNYKDIPVKTITQPKEDKPWKKKSSTK